jgi:hypothetical protein
MASVSEFRVEARDDSWVVTGPSEVGLTLVNDYLGYLRDRHYAPGTRRSYAFDLLALCRWLEEQHLRLDEVDTAVLLRFLTSCHGLAAATVNRRLAAISGLFTFRTMRDPVANNPMPRGPAGRRVSALQRGGLLGHLAQTAATVAAAGPAAAAVASRPGTRRGQRAPVELADLAGQGDRRADVVLRPAQR